MDKAGVYMYSFSVARWQNSASASAGHVTDLYFSVLNGIVAPLHPLSLFLQRCSVPSADSMIWMHIFNDR